MPAGEVVAGGVGAVSGGRGAADVDHDRIARLDHPIGQLMVGRGAVGARPDDDEVGRLVAFVDDRAGDVGADLALGAPGPQPFPHARVHAVDGGSGLTQRVDLVRLLADAQLLHERARRARCGSPGTRPGARRPARPTCGRRRRPWPRRPRGRPRARTGRRSRPTRRCRRRRRQATAAGRSSAGTTRVGSPSAGSTRQVSRSSGERVVPGEVAQVRSGGDQQGVDASFGGQVLGPGHRDVTDRAYRRTHHRHWSRASPTCGFHDTRIGGSIHA